MLFYIPKRRLMATEIQCRELCSITTDMITDHGQCVILNWLTQLPPIELSYRLTATLELDTSLC